MSRRKKKKSRESHEITAPAPSASFSPGSRVRVKRGTTDPDFEIPLGGWTGTVREIDTESRPPLFYIEWNDETLSQMHPLYRALCEREDLEPERMWLSAAELEPAGEGPVVLEQPEALNLGGAGQLDLEGRNRLRRIQEVLGQPESAEAELPPVNEENLRRYHRYLAARLRFPLPALYQEDPLGTPLDSLPATLKALAPEDQCVGEFGLLVETELGGANARGNLLLPLVRMAIVGHPATFELVEDYVFWFCEGRPEALLELSASNRRGDAGMVWRHLYKTALAGAVGGAIAGAILFTMDARIAVIIGAIVLGVLGYLAGSRYGLIMGAVNGIPYGAALGGVFGALAGALVGTLAGALVMGFLGTLPGSIAGNLTGKAMAKLGWKPLSTFTWTFFGAASGGLVLAWMTNQEQAINGAGLGAVLGAVLTLFLVIALVGSVMALTARRQ